ncbi:MAG: Kiwa anti-phage protein KwaB-like domain-containing protein [Peptococcaceae bacterium]
MFQNTTFFIMLKTENGNYEINRLNLTRESQEALCSLFSDSANQMINENNEFIEFDGRYKPDHGEVQYIVDYEIDDKILNALREPTGIDPFTPNSESLPDIKGIFTGRLEPYIRIAFQKFNKSQFITRKGISLFHNQNTFEKVSSFGINILSNIDCVYTEDGRLLFTSYLSARQIFDLSNFYRIATDRDVVAFVAHECVYVCNQPSFNDNADSWVRRKIALIADSGVLDEYSASQIAEKAAEYKVEISLTEQEGVNKLVFPDDKKEMKNILKFLDEDIYKGPLSSATFETNSKRRFNR